ncbi:MAG: glycosyltransferase family 2 protein [Caulobacter sp.]|nr:glycosyltransferase family 2 protein [Caulobacter sp.]
MTRNSAADRSTAAVTVGPRIGVVTVLYNSARVLPDFLESLWSQTLSDFRLYAVDNASADESLALMATEGEGGRIRVIANIDNLGVAEGNNQGIRAALSDGCPYILLLNNDTVFTPELLEGLIAEMDAANVDMITPKITYHDRPGHVWFGGGRFLPLAGMMAEHLDEGAPDDGRFDRPGSIAYAPTCCLLVRSTLFTDVGEMDARYFVYWDDVDFMLRARRAGKVLRYAPRLTLAHKVSALTGGGQSPFSLRYDTRNLVYFTRKFFPRAWPAVLLMHACRFTARYIFGRESWSTVPARRAAWKEGLALPLTTDRASSAL